MHHYTEKDDEPYKLVVILKPNLLTKLFFYFYDNKTLLFKRTRPDVNSEFQFADYFFSIKTRNNVFDYIGDKDLEKIKQDKHYCIDLEFMHRTFDSLMKEL